MFQSPRGLWIALLASSVAIAACGGGSSTPPPPPPPVMTLALAASSIDLQQDGNVYNLIPLTITNAPGAVSVAVTGLPAGITVQYNATVPAITISGGSNVPAGTYKTTVTATSGTQTASQTLTVVNDVVAVVSSDVDTTLGINGKLGQFMSTSFQIAQWTGDIFGSGDTAAAREKELTDLGAQHNRLQVIAGGMPMASNTGTAADWDFSTLDTTLQPVLASGDHSPEFQIGTAPVWMCDANGRLIVSAHANDFAAYAANLVRYYNKGGFDWGGTHFQSPTSYPITWWGIFNEYNGNGLSASEYLTLYNTTVPAMLAVDPTIKISALEYSDWGLGTGGAGDPMLALPTFLGTSSANGVNTQVDVLSTHFYGSCNQRDTDAQVFSQVPLFADNVRYFYKALADDRPDLAATQVWVTENNVNADYDDGTGHSTCNPGQAFVTDQRGTSAYFAAWRPYVFSQLGKAGNRALYHWAYSSDKQYGEVDASSNKYLSYWVDQSLATMFPSTASSTGQDILAVNSTDDSTIETLATKSADGTVVVMIVNRAVHAAGDNNGTGDPRTVVVELTDSVNFKSWNLLTIDASTDVNAGPKSVALWWGDRYSIRFNGYGVAFLTLKP
ncbi:MAG TPA: hypothetical protein VG225_12265 [Terracidiphilus sp.]|jgi:hypothetical protein|nr:hypothetical protein [Terracidiphilus sp.]